MRDPDGQTDSNLKNKVLLKIRQASDLPAMAETVNVVNRFKASEDTSVSDLANILLKDYALTTKILKLVNSVHYQQSGQVTTISRAIFLMGVDNIKNIAMTLMLFDQMQKHGTQSEVKDAILQAFCGGVIAQKIVEDLNYVEAEEAFICALLHPFGKIIVAHTMPEKTAEIRKLSEEQGISENQASSTVLGISYEEIGTTIATEWNYPQKLVQSMRHTNDPDAAESSQEGGKLSLLATLSTEMSSILATNAKKEDKAGKMKHLLASYENQIPAKNKNLDKLISTSAQEFTQLATVLDLDHKHSSFSEQLDKWSEDSRSSASDTAVLSFKTDALKTIDTLFESGVETTETIFSKGIQDINSSMLGTFALNDVIRIALETIYRGMKASRVLRVLFLVRDVKRPLMEIRLGFGADINEAKKWFVIVLDDAQNVFHLAVSKDSDLIIRNTDSADIRKYIPEWYQKHVPVGSYLLIFPVTINKRNIGLICVEGEKGGFEKIERVHLNYLRIMRDQIVIATKQPPRPAGKQPE